MIGKIFRHYHILKKIGQGGMGEVYLADDTSLQRKVALKFLPPEMQQDPSAHQRFMREAKSAAALDHPYICHINEVGEAESKDFIVMEYIEGQTLKERLAREPLSLKEAQQIAIEILEALEAAHEKGIVHRDLKPANIMLTRKGHVKVMDFGLAKQLIPASATQEETLSELTQSGTITGTLAYMSPEQMQGKPVDARSDIFSFGIVLYEMLAGVHPFGRASAMETASAILTETPLPLDRHKPGIPKQLQTIIAKLLAKNPLQRYQSAHEVHADLGHTLPDGQAASTGWKRFRWVAVAVALIVLVFGVVPLDWWSRNSHFKSPQAALAFQERDWILIADFKNLTGDRNLEQSLQIALTIGIQQSQYVNVFPPDRVLEALKRMRKESGVKLDEALACDLALREDVKAVLVCSVGEVGGVYSLTARLVEPGKRATVMSQTANAAGKNQILSTLDSLVKNVRQNLGESLSSISRQGLPLPKATTASLEGLKTYAESEKINAGNDRKARIELVGQAVTVDPDFALAHASLGVLYYQDGNRAEGEKHFTKALSLTGRLTTRETLWIRAVVEDMRGNSAQAVANYRSYLSQYPDDGNGWFRLGWLHMARLAQFEKAIEAFKRVLEIDSSRTGAYVNIATSYAGLRQDGKAIENYEIAFKSDPSAITGEYVNSEYGFLLARMGNPQKAADAFQRMIAAGNKASGYRSMALLAMYQGKYSDAIAHFKQAILINRAEKAVDSEYRDHMFLASAYRLKSRNAEFTSELAAADRILSRSPLDPGFISILAKTYARMGKTGEASRLLRSMTLQEKNLTAPSFVNRADRGDQAAISLVQGEIALANGKGNEAIESFELSHQQESHDQGRLESLAFAYRKLGKPQEAADKYQQISTADSLGQEAQECWILAHYELAKIYKELGDIQKAKEYYGKFFNIWKDADPDIPILNQAKAEYSKLQ